jgi:hypothetical protein
MKSAYARLETALFSPRPIAKVATAAAVKPGVHAILRRA